MTTQFKVNDPFTEWCGHSGPVIDVINNTEIIECEACGFRHVVPLPSVEDLQETYAQEYYRDEKPTYLSHASEDYEWAALAFQDRLEIFKAHLNTKQRKLLDIGSGPGYFLKYASDNGWNVRGIEPSAQAAQHTRQMGIPVTEAFFGPHTAKLFGEVDVVHMNNMLEHVPNPKELLEEAVGLLSADGLICISVPNDYNPFQEILRNHADFAPWWVVPSHHLNYFTFKSLRSLMNSLGFKVVAETTSFPMEMFLLMGIDYVGDAALGRSCHTKRKHFDLILERAGQGNLRRDVYELFAKLGLGREAIVIGKRA